MALPWCLHGVFMVPSWCFRWVPLCFHAAFMDSQYAAMDLAWTLMVPLRCLHELLWCLHGAFTAMYAFSWSFHGLKLHFHDGVCAFMVLSLTDFHAASMVLSWCLHGASMDSHGVYMVPSDSLGACMTLPRYFRWLPWCFVGSWFMVVSRGVRDAFTMLSWCMRFHGLPHGAFTVLFMVRSEAPMVVSWTPVMLHGAFMDSHCCDFMW